MKVAKIAVTVAVLLVTAYFVRGAFKEPSSSTAALDSASAAETGVSDQSPETVPLPQLAKPVEQLPASNAERVYAPEKKSQ